MRILCEIFFVNKDWPNREQVPLKRKGHRKVHGRFTLTIVRMKRLLTIAVEDLTWQAELPCPSRKLHLLRSPLN